VDGIDEVLFRVEGRARVATTRLVGCRFWLGPGLSTKEFFELRSGGVARGLPQSVTSLKSYRPRADLSENPEQTHARSPTLPGTGLPAQTARLTRSTT